MSVDKAKSILAELEQYAALETPKSEAWKLLQEFERVISEISPKLLRSTIHYDLEVWGYDQGTTFRDFFNLNRK